MKNLKHLHQVLPKHTRVIDPSSHRMPHYNYPQQQMQKIHIDNLKPVKIRDYIALFSVKIMRRFYDFFTKYDLKKMTQHRWLSRVIFLQTIAGVPGMCGGMCRHLRSIRLLKHDGGWIHHLLEQADNQRFHLMMFMNLTKPGYLMRLMILFGQGVFMNFYFITYLLNSKFCHRFTGYLENQAVKTYTQMIQQIDKEDGVLKHWKSKKAPVEAIKYYHFDENATYRDVILAVRADQASHRATNHFFAEVDQDYDIKEEKLNFPMDVSEGKKDNEAQQEVNKQTKQTIKTNSHIFKQQDKNKQQKHQGKDRL